MPMLFRKKIRNNQIASLILLVGVTFVCVQFLLVKYKYKENGNDDVRNKDSSYENIRLFTNTLHVLSIPVFLIDPHILGKVLTNVSQLPASCRFICDTPGVTSFGVLDNIWRNPQIVTERLEAEQFKVTHFSDLDPRLLRNNSSLSHSVPTHYLFSRHHHVIQLVVFYERGSASEKYWWHGSMQDADELPDNRRTNQIADVSQFGKFPGAYDELSTLKVTLDGIRLRAPHFPAAFLEQIPQSHFIECDYGRAHRFRTLHPATNDADQFLHDALELMQKAKRVLDSLKVRFWLSSGTCLGWFRQCSIIAHSKDVDFGIWIKDYNPRIIHAMETNGIFIKHIFGKVSDSFELSFEDGAVKLDLFFFYEDDTHMWNGGTQASTGKKFKYLFPKFTLCWTEFEGLRVRVPCNTLAYIEANYGLNWFEPVKSWDWKSSPPNVRPNGKWPVAERNKVIQTFS